MASNQGTRVGSATLKPVPKSTRKSLVAPSEPTSAEKEWLPLSNLDRVVTPTFTSLIHFFDGAATPFDHLVAHLKRSLALALVRFFPLAGRLELGSDGLVRLHCNDDGAVFIQTALEADLADLGGPQPLALLSGLDKARLGAGPIFLPDQIRSVPTLVVQVTRFRCGAVALATNWHHTVADGSAGCHFVKSWSEIASGREISVLPNHERGLLAPRSPLNPGLVRGYSTKTAHDLNEIARDRELLKNMEGSNEPAVVVPFDLDAGAVLEMKDRANRELGEEVARRYTSAEGISGFLWQQMTVARRNSAEEVSDFDLEGDEGGDCEEMGQGTPTRFFMFVDGRKKLGLPAGYFGNVVCSACAVATEERLIRRSPAYAAGLIRRAVAKADAEYFRSLIDWVEVQASTPSKSEHVNSAGHDVAATFWTFFPLYEMEFGLGRPIFATRNSPARPLIDGIAVMPSHKGPGNMVALLNLAADRMARIQNSHRFSSLFQNMAMST